MTPIETWRGQRAARDVAARPLLLLPLGLLSQPLLSLASKFAVGHWFEVQVGPAARVALASIEMPDKYRRLGPMALNILHSGFRAWFSAAGAWRARRLLRLEYLNLWLWSRAGACEVHGSAETRSVESKGNLLCRRKGA